MKISDILKSTIYYIVLSILISSICVGPFVKQAEAKDREKSNNLLSGLFKSSEESQDNVCTVFDSQSPMLFNLGDIPDQILVFINSIFSESQNNSNMIKIRDGERPSSGDVRKWITALPVSPASAGYSLSLVLEDSLCEQIALSAMVLERIWNGFKEAFIEAYGEDLWITLLKDLGFFAAGAALTMGYAALHATPVGWVIDVIVGTILVAWIAYNAYTFYDLISQDRYEDLGRHIFTQVNALVFGLAGVGAAAIAIRTIPSVGTFINAIRNRVSSNPEAFRAPRGLADLDNMPVVEEGGAYSPTYPRQPWESNFDPFSPGSGGGGTGVAQAPIRTSVVKSPSSSTVTAIDGISLKADATAVSTAVAGLPGIQESLEKLQSQERYEYTGPQFDADGELGILEEDNPYAIADADGGNNNNINNKVLAVPAAPDGYRGPINMAKGNKKSGGGKNKAKKKTGKKQKSFALLKYQGNDFVGKFAEELRNGQTRPDEVFNFVRNGELQNKLRGLLGKWDDLQNERLKLLSQGRYSSSELNELDTQIAFVENGFAMRSGYKGEFRFLNLMRAGYISSLISTMFSQFSKTEIPDERFGLASKMYELAKIGFSSLGIATKEDSFYTIYQQPAFKGFKIIPVKGISYLNDFAAEIDREYNGTLAFIPHHFAAAEKLPPGGFAFHIADQVYGIGLGTYCLSTAKKVDDIMIHERSHLELFYKGTKGIILPLMVKATVPKGTNNKLSSLFDDLEEGEGYSHSQPFDEIRAFGQQTAFVASEIESNIRDRSDEKEVERLKKLLLRKSNYGYKVSAQTVSLLIRADNANHMNQLKMDYLRDLSTKWHDETIIFKINDQKPFKLLIRVTPDEANIIKSHMTSNEGPIPINEETIPVIRSVWQRLDLAYKTATKAENIFQQVSSAIEEGNWELAIELSKKLPEVYKKYESNPE